ncbi:uncharacterized protein RAG0_06651 [Rhynchosporium agropyri]|uniref:2EXR domain-containing protein n=1 Tax=Rhynchosporium agropyri TaxID=914238 RepID=A0A1E1KI93_9HELO|nr:uncharacterized protein RAG0_06651 [Rhynchosporium agropyri]
MTTTNDQLVPPSIKPNGSQGKFNCSYCLEIKPCIRRRLTNWSRKLIKSTPELPTAESIPEEIGTFTRFPKLPLELRREIWKLSLPEGRHVGITVGNTCVGDTRFIGSPQEPPSTLRACKDSRVETLSCYTVIPVQWMIIQYPYGLPAPQTLYAFTFNPEADTLYADSSLCFNLPDRSSLIRWLKNLNETNGSVISSITSLEIREVVYEKLQTYKTTFNMFAEMQNPLLTFSALRVVRFTSMFSNRQAHDREFHELPDSYCFFDNGRKRNS